MEEATAVDVPQYPRGVYVSRVRARDGALVVFAVDSQGRTAGKIVLRGIVTLESATRLLRAKLDEYDPVPSLQLLPRECAAPRVAPHVSLALMGRLVKVFPRTPS